MHELEAIAKKIDQTDQNTTETRRILVESTVERPSVLDTLRKHEAQIRELARSRLQRAATTSSAKRANNYIIRRNRVRRVNP